MSISRIQLPAEAIVVIRPSFARACGDPVAGLLLSLFAFLLGSLGVATFYASIEELRDRFGGLVGRRRIRAGLDALIDLGVVQEKAAPRGSHDAAFYRLDGDAIARVVADAARSVEEERRVSAESASHLRNLPGHLRIMQRTPFHIDEEAVQNAKDHSHSVPGGTCISTRARSRGGESEEVGERGERPLIRKSQKMEVNHGNRRKGVQRAEIDEIEKFEAGGGRTVDARLCP